MYWYMSSYKIDSIKNSINLKDCLIFFHLSALQLTNLESLQWKSFSRKDTSLLRETKRSN